MTMSEVFMFKCLIALLTVLTFSNSAHSVTMSGADTNKRLNRFLGVESDAPGRRFVPSITFEPKYQNCEVLLRHTGDRLEI